MMKYFLLVWVLICIFTTYTFMALVGAPQESVVIEENLPQESVEPLIEVVDETNTPESVEPDPRAVSEKATNVSEKATNVASSEVECMALNIYHEARSDNFAGKIAVADVVLNRVESNRYPNTVCEVVEQSKLRTNWKGNVVPVKNMCQFSWFCDGLSDEPYDAGSWEEAFAVAEASLTQDKYRGITEGATHYHATYVTPNWIDDRGMQVVGRIGQHKFYRWQ